MSAYGGRGLALQRIYNSNNVQNLAVLSLAQDVALHKAPCKDITESEIKLVYSPVFTGGLGLQCR